MNAALAASSTAGLRTKRQHGTSARRHRLPFFAAACACNKIPSSLSLCRLCRRCRHNANDLTVRLSHRMLLEYDRNTRSGTYVSLSTLPADARRPESDTLRRQSRTMRTQHRFQRGHDVILTTIKALELDSDSEAQVSIQRSGGVRAATTSQSSTKSRRPTT